MAAGEHRSRVGVRELRQNLSVYLARVKEGESLDVTEHGHVVARVVPSRGDDDSVYERMVADGRITRGRDNLSSIARPAAAPGRSLSDVLRQVRDEDDR